MDDEGIKWKETKEQSKEKIIQDLKEEYDGTGAVVIVHSPEGAKTPDDGKLEQCVTCGAPNKSLAHRQECLAKSEATIFEKLSQNKERPEEMAERFKDEWQSKFQEYLKKSGAEQQTCTKCNNGFIPEEDGGTWDTEEGWVCGKCRFKSVVSK